MSLTRAGVLGPEKGRCCSQVCDPEKGRFVAESSLGLARRGAWLAAPGMCKAESTAYGA
jgi:hypothetical protein